MTLVFWASTGQEAGEQILRAALDKLPLSPKLCCVFTGGLYGALVYSTPA